MASPLYPKENLEALQVVAKINVVGDSQNQKNITVAGDVIQGFINWKSIQVFIVGSGQIFQPQVICHTHNKKKNEWIIIKDAHESGGDNRKSPHGGNFKPAVLGDVVNHIERGHVADKIE